jgi:hypothetical protein
MQVSESALLLMDEADLWPEYGVPPPGSAIALCYCF